MGKAPWEGQVWVRDVAYSDIVLEFNAPGGVELDFFQGLSDNIIRLALALLSGLDGSSLLYVAFVVNIELPEGIGQGKDVALLELRVFPVQ